MHLNSVNHLSPKCVKLTTQYCTPKGPDPSNNRESLKEYTFWQTKTIVFVIKHVLQRKPTHTFQNFCPTVFEFTKLYYFSVCVLIFAKLYNLVVCFLVMTKRLFYDAQLFLNFGQNFGQNTSELQVVRRSLVVHCSHFRIVAAVKQNRNGKQYEGY